MNYLIGSDGQASTRFLAASGAMRRQSPQIIPAHLRTYRSGLRGFGDTIDDAMDRVLNSLNSDDLSRAFNDFMQDFGFGTGKGEADIIVPMQNRLMYQLGLITDQILVGMNPSLATLQSYYQQVTRLANNFISFVLSPQFTDRRASGQALNTVMPYIDGTCGYAVPLGQQATPSQYNCISWGDGTIGGVGLDGMLGALRRAIVAKGGNVGGTDPIKPGGTGITAGFSSMGAVLIGVAAIWFFNRRRG